MLLRFASALAACILAVASPLSAQPVHFKFTDAGAGYNAFGIYIGTYGGTQDFGLSDAEHVGLNCVDYLHEVMVGQEWDANISFLGSGDISKTRHPLSLDQYKEAAWLIAQYNTTNVQAVQSTVWNLFGGNPGSNWAADPTLLAAAQARHPLFDYGDFYIVTDVNANGPQDGSSVQEFMVYDPGFDAPSFQNEFNPVQSAPEPASLVLFGTGFVGLLAFRARRRTS